MILNNDQEFEKKMGELTNVTSIVVETIVEAVSELGNKLGDKLGQQISDFIDDCFGINNKK